MYTQFQQRSHFRISRKILNTFQKNVYSLNCIFFYKSQLNAESNVGIGNYK